MFYLVNNDLQGLCKMDQIISNSSLQLGICVEFSVKKVKSKNYTHLGDKRRKQYFIKYK